MRSKSYLQCNLPIEIIECEHDEGNIIIIK
jgi:hypothetical protein